MLLVLGVIAFLVIAAVVFCVWAADAISDYTEESTHGGG
jgi:hypothetical protein